MADWFECHCDGMRVIRYDPPKSLGRAADLVEADVCFVCVPTPFGQLGFELSKVEAAIGAIPGHKLVVIKSTVWPGSTELMQRKFPQHTIMFNPEFLRERTAHADFCAPERQVMGIVHESHRAQADMVMEMLPPAKWRDVISARDAEFVKYFGNCYLAMRVTFANQMHDLCVAAGADYEVVKEVAQGDSRIGRGYLEVNADGYRGYGGTCFPKDMRALIQFGDMLGEEQLLLKACEIVNDQLRGDAEKRDAAGKS